MPPPSAGAPLHLLFLGCGAATRMHSRTLKSVADDVVRSYASRDGTRAEEWRERHGGAHAFGSYEEGIRNDEVDAVLVATPPDSHLDLTLAALDAGKHVIVEKPPFLRSSDFDTVREAAERAGRLVMVAENYFYKPSAEVLRGLLADGGLGEVRFLHVNAVKRQEGEGWRGDPALAGGGALFEGGIHWVNFMANLGLDVRRVHGFRAGPTGAPDRSMALVFEYGNGAVGLLSYSWEVHSPLRGVRLSRIYGTLGSVALETNGLLILQYGRRLRLRVPGLRDLAGYRAMFRDFVGALRGGHEPRFTMAAARRDLELVEEAYRSGS